MLTNYALFESILIPICLVSCLYTFVKEWYPEYHSRPDYGSEIQILPLADAAKDLQVMAGFTHNSPFNGR